MQEYTNKPANGNCEACSALSSLASAEEIDELLPTVPEWHIVEEVGVKKLTRRYKTADYDATIRLVNGIADLARAQGHHPVLLVEYRAVTVWWWSHKLKGIHPNDFLMAAKTDELFNKQPGKPPEPATGPQV